MGLFNKKPDLTQVKEEEEITDFVPVKDEEAKDTFIDEIDVHINGKSKPVVPEVKEGQPEAKVIPPVIPDDAKPVSSPKRKFTYEEPKQPEVELKAEKPSSGISKPNLSFKKTASSPPVDKQSKSKSSDEPIEYKKAIKEAESKGEKVKKEFAKVTVTEAKEGLNWTRAGLYLSALAMMGIIIFSQMAMDLSPPLFLLIWIFGMMCFLPLGVIAGWLFLDTYMRCKLLRRFRGKNYGIVNFLHVGSQRIVTRIKDFDDDVIVQDGRLWIINKDGVHYLDKDNKLQLHKRIESKHIKTLPANVPCLFLDPETMTPVSFKEERSKTNPQQAGAMILGYLNNQIRKNASLKRSMSLFYLIVIVVVCINMILAIQLYMWGEELQAVVPSLEDKIAQLTNLLADLTQPAP